MRNAEWEQLWSAVLYHQGVLSTPLSLNRITISSVKLSLLGSYSVTAALVEWLGARQVQNNHSASFQMHGLQG